MTYTESAQLMLDNTFVGRIKVSALKFADSIMGESSSNPSHNSRYRWAQQCFQSPDTTAQALISPVVMDAAVQSAGADITDAALQGSVEAVVNKII